VRAFAAMIALAWLEDAGPPYEPNALVAFAGEA